MIDEDIQRALDSIVQQFGVTFMSISSIRNNSSWISVSPRTRNFMAPNSCTSSLITQIHQLIGFTQNKQLADLLVFSHISESFGVMKTHHDSNALIELVWGGTDSFYLVGKICIGSLSLNLTFQQALHL